MPMPENAPDLSPDLAPVSPQALPTPTELLEPEEMAEPEFDPESIVEAVEAMLREGAPHDFDVIVIGAGPGGLACAQRLAEAGQQVALVEKDEIGGVCLNRGCIPTKTLLESIGALRLIRRASYFGVQISGELKVDFAAIHQRKRDVITSLRARARAALEEAGVQIIQGNARFVGAHTLEIETSAGILRKSAVHVVIATGGKPSRLPIPGNDLAGVLTSDEVLELETVPESLVVVGGGAVGVEFAAIFAELGTQVTLLEKMRAVLPGEDHEIQEAMLASLKESNIEVLTDTQILGINDGSSGLVVQADTAQGPREIAGTFVLMAAGRSANIDNLNLEEAGIEVEKGKIVVDDDKSTTVSGVWAIGDCIRRVGWAHQAALEGRMVADAILGVETPIDARFVPACYYTFPEVATVGLTVEKARELDIEAHAGKCSFRHNGRANTSGDNGGFVKLVVETGTGKLLGAQIIGPRATELINEIAVALREGETADKFADSLHAHPTFAEVLPGAARAALHHTEELD